MISSPRPVEPPVGEASAPFWEATRAKRLVVQWCTACERPNFYPREVCPVCLGSSLEWRDSQGRGRIDAFTVEHRPQPSFADEPYVIALVDLADGVRMMTNIVGCRPEEVRVGMEVVVSWEPLTDGRNLAVFGPAPETRAGGAR